MLLACTVHRQLLAGNPMIRIQLESGEAESEETDRPLPRKFHFRLTQSGFRNLVPFFPPPRHIPLPARVTRGQLLRNYNVCVKMETSYLVEMLNSFH